MSESPAGSASSPTVKSSLTCHALILYPAPLRFLHTHHPFPLCQRLPGVSVHSPFTPHSASASFSTLSLTIMSTIWHLSVTVPILHFRICHWALKCIHSPIFHSLPLFLLPSTNSPIWCSLSSTIPSFLFYLSTTSSSSTVYVVTHPSCDPPLGHKSSLRLSFIPVCLCVPTFLKCLPCVPWFSLAFRSTLHPSSISSSATRSLSSPGKSLPSLVIVSCFQTPVTHLTITSASIDLHVFLRPSPFSQPRMHPGSLPHKLRWCLAHSLVVDSEWVWWLLMQDREG